MHRRLALPLAVVAFAVVVARAGPAYAQRPRARCTATQLGRRTLGRVELAHFLDADLLRLVRLGLEGHFRVEIQLLRRRFAWFDDVETSVSQELVLTWDARTRRYLLNGSPVELTSLDPVRLERVPLGRRDVSSGSHYVEVEARLQVVTVASLRGMVSWVTGDTGGAGAVSRRLARMVVEDLIRRASGGCEVEGGRP